ncbi:MAG: hypothetical protein L0387_24895 [Acidobacteria bacterium]|nr:hypothetical protein [Acidobacteriota bacterium]
MADNLEELDGKNFSLAERALAFQYVLEKGLPPWANGDEIRAFAVIAGISESEATAAYAENQDRGLIRRDDD